MDLLTRILHDENYSLRFELARNHLEQKETSAEILYRASTIFDALFDKEDEIHLINCIDHSIHIKKAKRPKIKRYLRDKKQIYHLVCKTIPSKFDEDEVTSQYHLKVKKEDIRLHYLFNAIGNVDFKLKPRANGYIYLLNVTKEVLYYMYDDRGCIVQSLNKETLLPLYTNLSKWILDYDRIQIDRKFEQGLHTIYETDDEVTNRLSLNEKLVAKMDSKYPYLDHFITHHLHIPMQDAKKCIEELAQTGFAINIGPKNETTYIVNASKCEPITLIDYQSELMALYCKKYNGHYGGWTAKQ